MLSVSRLVVLRTVRAKSGLSLLRFGRLDRVMPSILRSRNRTLWMGVPQMATAGFARLVDWGAAGG